MPRQQPWLSTRVARVAATGVLVIVASGPGSTAAAAPARIACTASAPTASSAWRAFVPAGTPLRSRLGASARSARLSADDRWLLVLRRARGAGGVCLLEVRMADRPNTASAWVARERVSLRETRWRVEVSRARRTVTLLRAGRVTARWPAVVGAPATPTPAGTFAVLDSYRSPAGSFYGTWILILTAHSQVLDSFDGGDGRTGVHGRGGASLLDPLGTARSHGCVRLDNRAISAIVRRVGRSRLPGVPVVVR